MAYNVNFTDKINKGAIVVQDNATNTETSLQLPGKSLTSYGSIINTNFLHLLENFANTLSPSSPVEGQLWYDTTPGVDQLKIYDGALWVAASGIKKSANRPSVSASLTGDLWVDTNSQQLHLYSGSAWVLVGPDFSSGNETGPKFVNVTGTDNIEYPVVMTYVNNFIISIVSYKEFTPKLNLVGFTKVYAGLNLSSNIDGTTGKYYGTVEKSASLIVGGTAYAGESFARLSANNTFTKSIKVTDNAGIRIGETETFITGIDGSNAFLTNLSTDGYTELRVNSTTTGLRVTSLGNVGIKNVNPQSTLDVNGSIAANGAVTLTGGSANFIVKDGTVPAAVTKFSITSESGNTDIKGTLDVAGATTLTSTLNVTGTTTITGIQPNVGATVNIGTSALTFNNIHAENFIGTLNGTAANANKLSSLTNFSIAGDATTSAAVSFDGTGGDKTFNISIADDFINNKTQYTSTLAANQELILYNPNNTGGSGSQGQGVYKAKISQITSLMPTFAVGMIMPFAGTTAPSGWHICDGTSLSRSTYSVLFSAIGAAYGSIDVSVFNIPDTRGRNLLGLRGSAVRVSATDEDKVYDDAEAAFLGGTGGAQQRYLTKDQLPQHQHSLSGTDSSNTQYYAVTSTTGVTGDSQATSISVTGSVNGTGRTSTSNVTGLTNTTQTVDGVADLSVGNKFTTVSPFLTVNYIIYTGVTV